MRASIQAEDYNELQRLRSPRSAATYSKTQAAATAAEACEEKETGMDPNKEQLQIDLRYAQRLCERTARFYRRIQASLTFLTMLAGSGAIAALSAQMPTGSIWLGVAFAVFGCINMTIRPADRIAANDADVRKYAALLVKARTLDATAIAEL